MATVIERIELANGRWRDRHSALRLAVNASRDCIRNAGREPDDIDLLINAGIYRDRNLGEPALAAMTPRIRTQARMAPSPSTW